MNNMLAEASFEWINLALFIVTAISAVVTAITLVINYYFFRSQIDPHVIVYVTPDFERPTIILLIIENVGKSMAKDIRFRASRPIPSKAYGFENAEMPSNMVDGPLITGIPALGPGAKRIITWGQYGGLEKGLGNDSIEITVLFKSDRIGYFESEDHEVICPIDIKSFEGTDASNKAYQQKIADELHKISDTLSHSASGFRPLQVELKKPKTLKGTRSKIDGKNVE